MPIENTCLFVPMKKNTNNDLSIIHFVYETKQRKPQSLQLETLFKLYLVEHGEGTFSMLGTTFPIAKGTLFFGFPSVAYSVSAERDLRYYYISFLGMRGNALLERFGISKNNFMFDGFEELLPLWKRGIGFPQSQIDLIGESLLYDALACLGKKHSVSQEEELNENRLVGTVKKYLDDHFSEPSLSLEQLAHDLCYHKSYLSSLFKKQMKIGISDYLNTIRIQQARTMMQQNMTGIKDISFLCGFSDPLYFSKVFKKKTGVSPTEYIKEVKKRGCKKSPDRKKIEQRQ